MPRQQGRGLFEILQKVGLAEDNPKFAGEQHAKNYNYLGPFTALDKRLSDFENNKPINKLDEAAMKHDIAYTKANEMRKTIPQKAFENMINQSDDDFVKEVSQIYGLEPLKTLAKSAIIIKKNLEKSGLLDYKQFSQNGLGIVQQLHNKYKEEMPTYFSTTHNLKLQKEGVQSGGLAPILLALAPVLADFVLREGVPLIKKLFGKKGGGSTSLAPQGRGSTKLDFWDNLSRQDKQKQFKIVADLLNTLN